MAEGSVNVSVGASADEVWKTVGDFGGIDEFFPGIESFRTRGRRPGHRDVRHGDPRATALARRRGAHVDLLGQSRGCRSTATPPRSAVEPEGGGSKVTWSYAVVPDEMAPIFGDTYQSALNELESNFS